MIKVEDFKKYKRHAFINPFLPKQYKKVLMENYVSENPSIEDYNKIETAIKILKEFENENYWEYIRIPYEIRKKLKFEFKGVYSSYEDLQTLKKVKEIHKKIYQKHRKGVLKSLLKKIRFFFTELSYSYYRKNVVKGASYRIELLMSIISFGIFGLFFGVGLEIFLKNIYPNSVNKGILIVLPATFAILLPLIYLSFINFLFKYGYRAYLKEKEKFEKQMEKINKEFYKKLKKELPHLVED